MYLPLLVVISDSRNNAFINLNPVVANHTKSSLNKFIHESENLSKPRNENEIKYAWRIPRAE